ncbi:hypothetical protein TNCV_2859721 [Trichonephila clavipes]|nr:hypothetical protein TNCV_2859721 [Trichonephila clavipes]
MGMTNQRRIWDRKSRLVAENSDNVNLWEGDTPDEESGKKKCGNIHLLLKRLNGVKCLVFLQHFLLELLQCTGHCAPESVVHARWFRL